MPAAARSGGNDTVFSLTGAGRGCNSPVRTVTGAASQSSVFIGGVPAVVFGDRVGYHLPSGCNPLGDTSTLSTCSGTVLIDGKGVGRIGDEYGPDNTITSGYSTVFIGG